MPRRKIEGRRGRKKKFKGRHKLKAEHYDLPLSMTEQIDNRARERGIGKVVIVREAIQHYFNCDASISKTQKKEVGFTITPEYPDKQVDFNKIADDFEKIIESAHNAGIITSLKGLSSILTFRQDCRIPEGGLLPSMAEERHIKHIHNLYEIMMRYYNQLSKYPEYITWLKTTYGYLHPELKSDEKKKK